MDKEKYFNNLKKKRVSEEGVDEILRLIRKKKLKKGDRLPSERKLSELLGIGRNSIREMFRILETIKVIQVKSGIGAIIISDTNLLYGKYVWSKYLLFKLSDITDVLEIRELIDCRAARLAAKNINKESLEKLIEITKKMKYCLEKNDISFLTELDMKFHLEIVKISQNKIMLEIKKTLQEFIKHERFANFYILDNPKDSLIYHKKILNAIKEGDSVMAEKYALEHMINTKKKMIEIISKK
jgi:GntR family transcriptional repressor for pyruvate dehydrogenase complex